MAKKKKVLLSGRPSPRYVLVNGDRAERMMKFANDILIRRDCISESKLGQLERYIVMVRRDIDHAASEKS